MMLLLFNAFSYKLFMVVVNFLIAFYYKKKTHWSCVRSSSITSTTPKSKQSRSTFYFVHLQSLTIQSFFSSFFLYKKLYTCAHTKYLYFFSNPVVVLLVLVLLPSPFQKK